MAPGSPEPTMVELMSCCDMFAGDCCDRVRHRGGAVGVPPLRSPPLVGPCVLRFLCRVWSRRMRVLRCASPMPALRACGGSDRVWSRRVRVLRAGAFLVSRPPARGPFFAVCGCGPRGRAPSPEYWLSCFRLTGHCLFSRSETNRVPV